VEGQAVDTRKMPMIMADDLIGLKIPALDHLILPARKQVRMARTDSQTPDSTDMACKGKLETPFCPR